MLLNHAELRTKHEAAQNAATNEKRKINEYAGFINIVIVITITVPQVSITGIALFRGTQERFVRSHLRSWTGM